MNLKYIMLVFLTISNSIYAEFNLQEVYERPNYLELGYRNTITDKFKRVIAIQDYDTSFNDFIVSYDDYKISFYATRKNDNPLRGPNYYFINYVPEFVFNKKNMNYLWLLKI